MRVCVTSAQVKALISVLFAVMALQSSSLAIDSSLATGDSVRPYGLSTRPPSKPYLSMPELANGEFPPLLSQTGAFESVRRLTPNPTLIPYELNVPFWSDGASKSRWISLPEGKIEFSPTGE